MSKIPAGNFTIVNNETGRCVRVRLGRTKDVSDYKEGTKYLQYVTDKPTLELGTPDNSPSTAWWFNTTQDGVERQPFNQIVNFAVDEYQNIGRYGVWMYTDYSDDFDDRNYSEGLYESRLNDLPVELRTKLGALIPKEWHAWHTKSYSARLEDWKEAHYETEEMRVRLIAELEAWAADEEPLSADKFAQLKAIRERKIAEAEARARREWERAWRGEDEETDPYEPSDEARPQKPSKEELALLKEVETEPRAARIESRTEELLPAAQERRNKALELEWQRRAPVASLEEWHMNCALLAFHKNGVIRLTNHNYESPEDRKVAAAVRAYTDAAAKEGIKPLVISQSAARTELYGCGASRHEGSTYRWVYDGTHIYGADSKTVPAEQTYWTDEDGRLVGKNKGGPGQTWTLAPWKPSPQATDPVRAVVLTGLFGPLGVIFGM
ncbi:hypothetical protein [Streptomyces sp. NPDC054975]